MAAEQQPAASWGADTDGRLNQSSEHLTEHAMLSTDASGNTVLVGGDGGVITPRTTTPRFVLIGDSIFAQQNANRTITAMVRSGNEVTCTLASHATVTGQRFKICNAMPDSFNGEYPITWIDADSFKYTNAGPNESATLSGHPSGGSFDSRLMDWYKSNGWWVWTDSLFGCGLELVKNMAVGGWTAYYAASASGLAFLEKELAGAVFSDLCIGYGVNDLSSGRTPSQVIQDLETLAEWGISKGARVWIDSVKPVTSGHSAASTINAKAPVVNRLITEYAKTRDGVYYVDTYSSVVNPITGEAKANYTEDTIHPSVWGARVLLAPAWYAAMNGVIKPGPSPLMASSKDNYGADSLSKVLYDDAPWANTGGGGTGGTVTGTVGVNLRITESGSASVAASIAARSDGFGYNQIMEMTATANADYCSLELLGEVAARFQGKRVRLFAAFELTGNTAGNIKGLYSGFTQTVGGVTGYCYGGAITTTNALWGTSDDTITGILSTPSMFINAAATAVNFEVAHLTAAGAGISTLKVGRITVVEV